MQQMLHCEMLQANTIAPKPLQHIASRVASVSVRRISSTGYLVAVQLDGAVTVDDSPAQLQAKYSYGASRGGASGRSSKLSNPARGNKLNKATSSGDTTLQYNFQIDVPREQSYGRGGATLSEPVLMQLNLPNTGEVLEFAITLPSEEAP